jgi:membrane-associated phospholipid phosphatase
MQIISVNYMARVDRGCSRRLGQNAALMGTLIFISALACVAQNSPAPPSAQPTAPPATAPSHHTPANTEPREPRQVSWKTLVPNILHDQRPIWLFPAKAAEGQHVVPAASFIFLTSGLVALDSRDAPYFRRTQTFNEFNRVLSGRNASIGMAAFPAGFYIAGLLRKNSYDQQSVLLAGEAVVDSELVTTALKDIDGRLRPSSIAPNGNFEDTWFADKTAAWRGRGSFPSGHMIAAMSIATVFADRYPQPRWHRWVAFGLAGVVGFSRITTQAHFPSDVFAGAVLGYTITHFVVLRPR